MKKNRLRSSVCSIGSILFFTYLFFPTLLTAQKKSCATVLPPGYESERIKQPAAYEQFLRDFQEQMDSRSSCINYAPIKAHIVRRTDGTGGLTEAQLNSAIATANTFYANSCMAFYICGAINYIDDDNYYDFDTSDEGALTGANNVANAINIYFCNSVADGPDFYCGYAYYPGGPDHILMDNSCTLNGSTLSHEIGHFFSLPHTHNGGTELVNGSNCATAGDQFCDTPADPQLSSGTVNSSCVYTGSDTDANGETYVPNTRNVMSYSRKSCRTEFSSEQYAAMSFTYLNVRNYWDCADFNVDFSANTTIVCDAPYSVSFTENCVGESTYAWDFDNDGIVDDTDPNPSYTYPTAGTYDVHLTVSNGTATISKVKTEYINVGAESFPYVQSLEGFTASTSADGYGNGWVANPTATTSGFRRNLGNDGTPSTNTGPDVDHTTGGTSGIFAFSEATGSSSGDVAELTSPCMDVAVSSNDPSIRFWYHMFGSHMGTLHVDLYDGSTWINDFTPAITGQQQASGADAYLERVFSVSAYKGMSIQIRFRAIRGTGFRSDMAIDDFELFENMVAAPVELVSFKGEIMPGGEHQLTWQTASEQNSDYFLVEHATDGVHFEALEKVNASGNSFSNVDYAFLNRLPRNGINYYRLKIVDWDESAEYSPIVQLKENSANGKLTVIPNPGKGLYQLSTNSRLKNINYQVTNMMGINVQEGYWNTQDGSFSLDLQHLSNGVYMIQLFHGAQIIDMQKLIKQ